MDPFTWVAFALLIVSSVITALTQPKPKNQLAPAGIGDFNIPQIVEGTAQEIIFGDVWSDSWMVLYYGNLQTVPIYSKSGGKK